MNFYEKLLPITNNEFYLNRYLNFLDFYKNQKLSNEYIEKHHILPVSLFPNLKKDPKNIIKLTARQHFLAHWMLAKLTNSPKMWFAFNQMKRLGNNSILYHYAKIEISKVISESNKGRIRSIEHIESIKKSIKGKKPAKDVVNNNIFWAEKDDPRWDTGELISPRKGFKHKEETKSKIRNANRGKKIYQNNKGQIKMFYPDQIPDGFFLYNNPAWHESNVKDTYWAYNPQTEEHLRLNKNEFLPVNFIKGRLNHQGFKNINNSNKTKYIDLYLKEYVFLSNSEVNKKRHARFDGQKLDKIIIMLYNNQVLVGKKHILNYLKGRNIFLSYDEIKSGIVKSIHHNNNKETHNFRLKNQGKKITDIGIYLYNLKDFQMKEKYNIKENE